VKRCDEEDISMKVGYMHVRNDTHVTTIDEKICASGECTCVRGKVDGCAFEVLLQSANKRENH
jgi:hypothetical protein